MWVHEKCLLSSSSTNDWNNWIIAIYFSPDFYAIITYFYITKAIQKAKGKNQRSRKYDENHRSDTIPGGNQDDGFLFYLSFSKLCYFSITSERRRTDCKKARKKVLLAKIGN